MLLNSINFFKIRTSIKNQNVPLLRELEEKYEELKKQLIQTEFDIEIAESFFNYAEPIFMSKDDKYSYIDSAILYENSVKQRHNLLLKEIKAVFTEIEKLKKIS